MTTLLAAPPVSSGKRSSRPRDTILVVDHQAGVRRLVEIELGGQGYRVITAESAGEALAFATSTRPALAILEPLVPGGGHEFLSLFRDQTRVPVIVLTLAHDARQQVEALDLGAEDYVTKPFNPDELGARVRAVLRRLRMPWAADVLRAGSVTIDLGRRTVRRDGRLLALSPVEWKLLLLFAANVGRALTGPVILREVWGAEYANESIYLRVWVHRLRAIVEPDPAHPSVVRTVQGVGYRLDAVPVAPPGALDARLVRAT